ncbi:MAG: AI-2E family transporter [Acidobacteriota bacterium]|nr:AI-2E family transporter [Acidobacteriota bacterium]
MSDAPRPRHALEELLGGLPLRFTAIFILLIVALWLLRQALMPFFVAMVLAYLLSPMVERLSAHVRRGFAVVFVLSASLALVAVILVLALPALSDQFARLYASLPHWQELLMKKLGPIAQAHPAWVEKARGALDALDPAAALRGLLQAGSGLLGFVLTAVTLILVPLILYHLLLDGPRMLASLESLVPPRFRNRSRGMVSEIHERLGGFIRGQIAVALAMALLQSVALSLLGVPYAWLLGTLAGLFTVIPYSSYLVGLVPALVLEMLQGASGARLCAVALTFAAVQAVEGLYLTPVWVGRASKLHPLEVLLALVAFGHWFGLLGLLFAVPLMVTVKVVFRVLLEDYRQHPWFTEVES